MQFLQTSIKHTPSIERTLGKVRKVCGFTVFIRAIWKVPWLFVVHSQRMATHFASFYSISELLADCFCDTKTLKLKQITNYSSSDKRFFRAAYCYSDKVRQVSSALKVTRQKVNNLKFTNNGI